MYKIVIDDISMEVPDYDTLIDMYAKNYKTATKLIIYENGKIIGKKA